MSRGKTHAKLANKPLHVGVPVEEVKECPRQAADSLEIAQIEDELVEEAYRRWSSANCATWIGLFSKCNRKRP